jgi:hypothetical protein
MVRRGPGREKPARAVDNKSATGPLTSGSKDEQDDNTVLRRVLDSRRPGSGAGGRRTAGQLSYGKLPNLEESHTRSSPSGPSEACTTPFEEVRRETEGQKVLVSLAYIATGQEILEGSHVTRVMTGGFMRG